MSEITELIRRYTEGDLDFEELRDDIRQVQPKQRPATDSPWMVDDDDLDIEGTADELATAATLYDLDPEEYRLLVYDLAGTPPGVRTSTDPGAATPEPQDSNPQKPQEGEGLSGGLATKPDQQERQNQEGSPPAQQPAAETSPTQPAADIDRQPISLFDLLKPEEEGRPTFVPGETSEPDEKRRRLAKHLQGRHDEKLHGRWARNRPRKPEEPSRPRTPGQQEQPGQRRRPGQTDQPGQPGQPTQPATTPGQQPTAPPEAREGREQMAAVAGVGRGADRATRPMLLSDMFGLEDVRKRLGVMVKSAKQRGKVLDHILFTGPPGLGKTTLAKAVANEMGANVRVVTGSAIQSVRDLANVLTSLNEGDVLFIDEIHAMPREVDEALYPAMEDFEIDVKMGGRPVRVQLPQFTLIGATTNPEGLPKPLRDRFGATERLDYYEPADLAKVAKRTASQFGIQLDDQTALEIGRRGRGTPRIVNRMMRRIRDYAVSSNKPVNMSTVTEALDLWGLDSKGLTREDRQVLRAIKEFDRPVGVRNVADLLGMDEGAIAQVVEPYLLQQGLIRRTPRGRVITEEGKRHLAESENLEKRLPDIPLQIAKMDSRRNLVFGWANVALTPEGQVVDRQGDLIDVEDLEEAAYKFVVKYRLTGDMHQSEGFGELVESLVVTPDKVNKAGFPPEMLGRWWVGFKVPPEHWDKVVTGKRRMFSIQGRAKRIPVDL